MLRETDYIKPYPSKTIIEDVISRDGPATDKDFTPFEGQRAELLRQFSGKQKSAFRERDFVKHNSSRDLDPTRIPQRVQTGILDERTGELAGFKTLEDVVKASYGNDAVKSYLVQLCVGFKKDNTSPMRTNREMYTRTVRNIDGEDDSVEEKFLMNREDAEAISNEDYEDLIKELPHILRSIWSYSKQMQGNLFSFALAYADIVNKKGTTDISVTDFMGYPTYLIKKDGTYVRHFDHERDNKYTIYGPLTKVFIVPGSYRAEYDICMKYLHALEVLGIDYRDEDPLVYNNEFMSNMVCTYLPTNEQYFSDYSGLDVEIMYALRPENILSLTKSHIYKPILNKTETRFDFSQSAYFVSERLDMAYKIGDWEPGLLEDHPDDAIRIIEKFLTINNKGIPVSVPRQMISFEADGFTYFNKSLLYFKGDCLGTFKLSSNYTVAVTRFGIVIALEESYEDVYYLTIEDVYSRLEEYEKNGGSLSDEANWKSL